ncbi:MAG TPA: hypothetical protein DDX40_00690 [Rikenellaceae bacterium]|nr:hypothetical protein [Rikenellaceae bacterium]
MAHKQLQNDFRVGTPAFCEYGGTQTSPEYGEKPVDMPTMVSGGIAGIQLRLTMAWRHDRMPPSRKMATRASFEKATLPAYLSWCGIQCALKLCERVVNSYIIL